MMADSTASIGVRGAYSAAGAVGHRHQERPHRRLPDRVPPQRPRSRIQLPPLDKIKNVGITLRREVSPDLCAGHQALSHLPPRPGEGARQPLRRGADGAGRSRGEEDRASGRREQKEEAFAALKANKTGSATGTSTRRWRSCTASGCSTPTSSPTTRTWCSRRISCSAIACTAT